MTAEKTAPAGLTIEELADETGMTARNIRAHQSRGLLQPPEVRSRTAHYSAEHVARIRLIQDMQAQGFNLKAIQRLLELGAAAGSEGALAFERAILTPFAAEQPEVMTTEELTSAFGGRAEPKALKRAERIGLIRPLGDGAWEVPAPALLRAGSDAGRARDPPQPRVRGRGIDPQAHLGNRPRVRPPVRPGRARSAPRRRPDQRAGLGRGEAGS